MLLLNPKLLTVEDIHEQKMNHNFYKAIEIFEKGFSEHCKIVDEVCNADYMLGHSIELDSKSFQRNDLKEIQVGFFSDEEGEVEVDLLVTNNKYDSFEFVGLYKFKIAHVYHKIAADISAIFEQMKEKIKQIAHD